MTASQKHGTYTVHNLSGLYALFFRFAALDHSPTLFLNESQVYMAAAMIATAIYILGSQFSHSVRFVCAKILAPIVSVNDGIMIGGGGGLPCKPEYSRGLFNFSECSGRFC